VEEEINSSEMRTFCFLEALPIFNSLSKFQKPRLFSSPVLREQEKYLRKPTASFLIEEKGSRGPCVAISPQGMVSISIHWDGIGSFIAGRRYMIQESILAPILPL
jgi:hypothetical protein